MYKEAGVRRDLSVKMILMMLSHEKEGNKKNLNQEDNPSLHLCFKKCLFEKGKSYYKIHAEKKKDVGMGYFLGVGSSCSLLSYEILSLQLPLFIEYYACSIHFSVWGKAT